ncbi:hypothetical protein K461DRAFT_267941 [Myriangium duriaei CBS 260.36]|uniref:Uncharacterized protein n=1 Tax=Myriangium duriaei CBS 260.36 TaxID=1168546 RepID=A0A9P4J0Q9_9PEZI|nr:hypothetical protein K461DRAFT_267941 [Myriangium duriaei CBS 260.36]
MPPRLRPLRLRLRLPHSTRRSSTSTTNTNPSPPTALQRLQSRLPPRLRPYLNPLLSAPVSHITSFLMLHELTAILPLAGLFSLFHYSSSTWTERWRARLEESPAFTEGVRKWGSYARKKGWVKDEEADGGREVYVGQEGERVTETMEERTEELAGKIGAEEAVVVAGAPRVVLELAAAWAVTKVLLPARLAVSVWATPWFARVAVVPVSTLARRLVRR